MFESEVQERHRRNGKKEGDWVCRACQNYNFAFRTVCNRCRGQTKEQNEVEEQAEARLRERWRQALEDLYYRHLEKAFRWRLCLELDLESESGSTCDDEEQRGWVDSLIDE
jgi:hypothetical protein